MTIVYKFSFKEFYGITLSLNAHPKHYSLIGITLNFHRK